MCRHYLYHTQVRKPATQYESVASKVLSTEEQVSKLFCAIAQIKLKYNDDFIGWILMLPGPVYFQKTDIIVYYWLGVELSAWHAGWHNYPYMVIKWSSREEWLEEKAATNLTAENTRTFCPASKHASKLSTFILVWCRWICILAIWGFFTTKAFVKMKLHSYYYN